MRIELAGFNVEKEILDLFDPKTKDILTPEIFSSAYARISRSPKDVTSLRKIARKDIEKSRKRNERIIFKMGHHSVAEHAVFNFDIIGVSRLALEEIEHFRLASYTEKSQRYVTLKGDYVLPPGIDDQASQDLIHDIVARQNAFYMRSLSILQEFLFDRFPGEAATRSGQKELENLAKEDARYILSLATEGQVGMTINARSLEHLFRRFRMSGWQEVVKIGDEMYRQVMQVAPSLILFPEPSLFEQELKSTFKESLESLAGVPGKNIETGIVDHTRNGDDVILASLLAVSRSIDYLEARQIVMQMETGQKEELFKTLFRNMEFFDSPPREFEMVDITFQAVISASNFAQLKRHRMASLSTGPYNITFENTVPPNIIESGCEEEFREIISETNRAYKTLKENHGSSADYILTNSHRRQVLMKMNLREVFHFIRLRGDAHAQWDIRRLASRILEELRPVMPYSTMLLCGKSGYLEKFNEIYGTSPRFNPDGTLMEDGGQVFP